MRWLLDNLATAAFNEVSNKVLNRDVVIFDVRDLVDKSGNDEKIILRKIQQCLELLESKFKVIICCDYGLSRSNSVAVGVVTKWLNIDFYEAARLVESKVDQSGIKIEMLHSVYSALNIGLANSDRKQSIFVTGGTGFVGNALLKKLATSFSVFAPTSNEVNLIHDPITFDLFVKKNAIDTIVHLANPKVFTTNKSVGDTLVMLKNVLDVCRTNGTRLIFLSGWEIYSGYKSMGLIADENLAQNPKGTYGETKWLCELLIEKYVNNYGVKCQIIRSGPVFGINGEKPKFIFNFIRKALSGQEIVTHKYLNGFPSLDLLYIDDLVDLICKACEGSLLEDVNVGSGLLYSTHEIAKIICKLIGSNSTVSFVEISDFAPNVLMDNRKAKLVYDWHPKIQMEDGLRIVIEAQKKSYEFS